MADAAHNLTGVWHGRFTYPRWYEPGTFIAILVETGGALSGTTEEACTVGAIQGMTLHGVIQGSRREHAVRFVKTYDGTGGWSHAVVYDGTLSSDGTEIEGRWRIAGIWSGTFLMIRSTGLPEAVEREAFVPA